MAKKRKKTKHRRTVGRYCAKFAKKGSRKLLRRALKRWLAEESKESRIARKMVCIAGAKRISKAAKKRLAQMVNKWHAHESREHKLAKKLIALARRSVSVKAKHTPRKKQKSAHRRRK
jgi:hypothetical protein